MFSESLKKSKQKFRCKYSWFEIRKIGCSMMWVRYKRTHRLLKMSPNNFNIVFIWYLNLSCVPSIAITKTWTYLIWFFRTSTICSTISRSNSQSSAPKPGVSIRVTGPNSISKKNEGKIYSFDFGYLWIQNQLLMIRLDLDHRLRMSNEAYFHQNCKILCLSRQFGQTNFGAFGVFSDNLSVPILVLSHCYFTILNHRKKGPL